jgi:ethanolamine utilization protein EutA
MTHDTDTKHTHHYHIDPGHTHDDYHVGPDFEGPIEDHPLWQRENVNLTSVGIDIGSAGTQILFSHLHLKRQSVDLSSRYLVVSRETWYESPVSLTPYESEAKIDARALGEIVDLAYNEAKIHPDDIDTGVVILTGEALRRGNSERIGQILSEKCGELVCVAAGHHMEATLAAHGSGAVQASHDRKERIINIDIGGGTTKLSIIDKGIVQVTAALHIGGRLLAVDSDFKLQRLEPAGRAHAKRAGYSWRVGDTVTSDELDAVAEHMTDILVQALVKPNPGTDILDLYLTDPILNFGEIKSVVFSGGVSEFIYEREPQDFGDLGMRLGKAIRQRLKTGELPWQLIKDSEGIRATVLGASEYSTQLSGNTGFISDPGSLLPRRNLQVVHPDFEFKETFESVELAEAIHRNMQAFDLIGTDSDIVLAFHWSGHPDYHRVRALADGIKAGIKERVARGKSLFVILDADIAMNLGTILRKDLGIDNEIMVIDGVALWNFDFIDIGKMREPSNTVPVMIKSLVFKDVTDDKHRFERISFKDEAPQAT